MNIPLSNPDITSSEKEYVMHVLNTPQLSLGPRLTEFEQKFAAYIGSKHAIAVNSGTSGLHLCIKATGIKKGDEVLTTPFSFVASANCILYEQATPVFVDIDPVSLNIDTNKIEEKITSRSKGILPVHVFGIPCEIDKVLEIANTHELSVIEDACEAIGAEFPVSHGNHENYRKVGTFGQCGVFAFYPNKQMTTGEGGMIVTDDDNIAEMCRSLKNQGRGTTGKWLVHEHLGYNYRLSDINCALGIAQINRITEILKKRETVAHWYKKRLSQIEQIKLPVAENGSIMSWFVFVIILDDSFSEIDRDNIITELSAIGIGCNKYFPPIHLQPFYQKMFGYKKGDFPITEHISERTIALPFFSNLSEIQVDYVCNQLIQILKI